MDAPQVYNYNEQIQGVGIRRIPAPACVWQLMFRFFRSYTMLRVRFESPDDRLYKENVAGLLTGKNRLTIIRRGY